MTSTVRCSNTWTRRSSARALSRRIYQIMQKCARRDLASLSGEGPMRLFLYAAALAVCLIFLFSQLFG